MTAAGAPLDQPAPAALDLGLGPAGPVDSASLGPAGTVWTDGPQPVLCRFTVLGVPATQAGMRSVPTEHGYRQITTGGKELRLWRVAVADAARETAYALGSKAPLVEPLAVEIFFRFPMPAARPKYVRKLGRCWRAGKRDDLDKLERAIYDSLTVGGLIADDGLIVENHNLKAEHAAGWTGAEIVIRRAA